jgi:hypothetical protein
VRHEIAFLHTAGEHVAIFGALMSELAPQLAVRYQVDESLLAKASTVGAAELCQDLRAPILASPRLGVEAAIAAFYG